MSSVAFPRACGAGSGLKLGGPLALLLQGRLKLADAVKPLLQLRRAHGGLVELALKLDDPPLERLGQCLLLAPRGKFFHELRNVPEEARARRVQV